MNKIYKVIWSKAKHCYVVTSELAKRHTKGSGVRSVRAATAGRVLCTLLLGAYLTAGYSMPVAWGVEAKVAGSPNTISESASGWGYNTIANGNFSTAFGYRDGDATSELGSRSWVSVSWGYKSKAIGNYSTAFGGDGTNNTISTANAVNSLAALGGTTDTAAANSAAIGKGATASLADTVALGSGSVTTGASGVTTAAYRGSNTGGAWIPTHNAIAVGNDSTVTRQITGVAAGSADTDAVNVAQLTAIILRLPTARRRTWLRWIRR